MKCLVAVLPFLLAVAPALAAPRFLPDQDVAVSYQLASPGNPAQDVQLSYSAAAGQARIDSPQGLYVLASLPTGQAQVVIPALHAFVEAPDFSSLTRMIGNADGASFTPLGGGFYAGLPCEKYLVLNTQGSATACITPQGVVLHFAGRDAHGSAELTALSVAFSPQAPGNFLTPEGYTEVTLPPGALAALLRGQ
jgi:hypothetical protein